jgi:hypothetical protein
MRTFGGTTYSRSFNRPATLSKERSNSTYASASFFENRAMFSASRDRSPHNVSEVPSGNGTK